MTGLILALGLAAGIFVLDLLVPLGSTEWLLYFLPVFVTAWSSPRWIIPSAFFCSLLTILGFFVSAHGVDPRIAAVNRALAILVFWALAAILVRQKRAERAVVQSRDELEIRVEERTADLARANRALQEEITERQKAEDHLRQAHKMEAIGTLAGGIAHDFNSVLSAIVTNAEVALLDLDGDSPVRRNLEDIVRAGLHGRDLIRQILAFSRKSESEDRLTALSPVLRDAFRLLRASVPTAIEMELRIDAEQDVVLCDPAQVQQVVLNLCTNAASAIGGKPGRIAVSLERAAPGPERLQPDIDMAHKDCLVLTVSDTGCGMTEDVKRRMFEPFFTTKGVGEGTGLGLSVVYGIVKSHGGAISVSSEREKGTSVKVYLPRAETVLPDSDKSVAVAAGGSEHILLVDDDEMLANSLSGMLGRLGYRVTVISESMAALKAFVQRPDAYDLVILDQMMPLMTGDKLAAEMLAVKPRQPVILCTGNVETISEQSARTLGIQGYLLKPFTMQEGAAAVRRLLDRKRGGSAAP